MKPNYFTAILLACIIQATAIAQPTIRHQKTIGGSGDDIFSSMYLTKDGGLIAGGYSVSNISGEKTENSRGSVDYWVVKLDRKGTFQWDKTIGGSMGDFLYSLQQTADGGYILGGWSYSDISGEKTENSRGSNDYWVVKLDSLGKIQWDKTIGGISADYLYSLQQTDDGGYILGGYSYSNISGEKTENSRGLNDYWVVKLDSMGEIEWDKTIGGSESDNLNALQQTSDAGYILGGYSYSNISGEKTENSRGLNDYWVVKLDSLGKIQWDKTIGGNDYDPLTSLQETCDGGYILGGFSASNISGEKTENSRGLSDYWVVKLDRRGTIQWDKTIGGSESDELYSLQQTRDGGYILGGYSSSNISGEKTENNKCGCISYLDYWVVKLDRRGTIQWDKTIGGSSDDILSSIKEVSKNRYVLGGYSYSGISGDKTDTSRGDADYWLVELKYKVQDSFTITTLQNGYNLQVSQNKNNKAFTVYPNPVRNILHVQVSGKANLSLTDQTGKILLTKIINGSGEINITALPTGLYYLKNNATGAVQKVIVTK